MTDDRVAAVARTFDGLADVYDRSGVEFFGPIAAGLVEALALTPGERVLDLGCGAGAVLLRAAHAVAPGGSTVGLDVSELMVATTREAADALGATDVEVIVGDAQDPALPAGAFDVIASSLVLFFLPGPAAALERWRGLLAPGGRLGLATFGERDETFEALDGLFSPFLPPTMLDARTSGTRGPFASDHGMIAMVEGAGFVDARTVSLDLAVRFADVSQWEAFSRSTGQAAMWGFAPEAEHDSIRAAAAALLAPHADADGSMAVRQRIRYTLARAPIEP